MGKSVKNLYVPLAAWTISCAVLTLSNLLFHGVLAYSFFYGRLEGIILAPKDVHSTFVMADYALLTTVNLYFTKDLPRQGLALRSAVIGGVLGLVAFGTWNLVNYAFIPNWPLAIVAVDIPWHIVVGAISGWVLGKVLSK